MEPGNTFRLEFIPRSLVFEAVMQIRVGLNSKTNSFNLFLTVGVCEIEKDQGEEKYCIVQLVLYIQPLHTLKLVMLAEDYFVLFSKSSP